jgi:hypothetical protein
MKRSVLIWQLVGFTVAVLFGTLLHFLYEWSGESLWIAPFSGVNESTWEHMKLLFWPCFIFALIQGFFFKAYKEFWCVKLRGILLGIGLIPIIFYTYNGVIGKSPDFVNIAIFFISAGVGSLYEWVKLRAENTECRRSGVSLCLLCLIAMLFVIFTFHSPHIGLFCDPITKGFGI